MISSLSAQARNADNADACKVLATSQEGFESPPYLPKYDKKLLQLCQKYSPEILAKVRRIKEEFGAASNGNDHLFCQRYFELGKDFLKSQIVTWPRQQMSQELLDCQNNLMKAMQSTEKDLKFLERCQPLVNANRDWYYANFPADAAASCNLVGPSLVEPHRTGN